MQLRVAVYPFVLAAWLVPGSGLAAPAPVVLHDVELIADDTFIRGAEASVYVATFGATDLTSRHPLRGARVAVSLVPAKEKRAPLELARTTTAADGTVALRFTVPRSLATGDYRLVVHTSSRHGKNTATRTVSVDDATRLHLRTDRGMYAPGQTVRWRVIAINNSNAHPLPGQEINVSIQDPRGTAIWRGKTTTDATGMVQGAIPLDSDVLLGTYTLVASYQDVETTERIQVRAYRLPAFTVAIEPEGQGPPLAPYEPGSKLKGHVVARYLHGEPVSGEVYLRARSGAKTHAELKTRLDSHGRARFAFTVPKNARALMLSAKITETSGRIERSSLDIPLPAKDIEIAIIPEKKALARDTRQWVTILTTDGQGQFVAADLRVQNGQNEQRLRTQGALRIPITPTEDSTKIRVHARALSGPGTSSRADIEISSHDNRHRWIRPTNVVVRGGEAIEITGTWSKPQGPLAVTLLREGAPLATTVANVDAKGALRARLVPPPGVFGLATVRITDARWDEESGVITPEVEQASVFIRPTELDVSIEAATRYKPGEVARVDVAVRDRAGQPVAGAGLAASVVDERALLLAEPGPDLSTALRELDTGKAETAGLVFARLLESKDTAENRAAMRALIEALPPAHIEPHVHITAADRMRDEIARMESVYVGLYQSMITDHRPLGKSTGQGWDFARPLDEFLARRGWKGARRLTPWQKPMDWAYVRRLDPEKFEFETMAEEIGELRLKQLAEFLREHPHTIERPGALASLIAQGKVARYLGVDPWGTAVLLQREPLEDGEDDEDKDDDADLIERLWELRSAGPDLAFDTDDDIVYMDVLHQGTFFGAGGYGTIGHGSGGGGMGIRSAGVPSVRIGNAMVEVTVRKRFDETVLWVAGVRTDSEGKAALEVPLADSITGWRVEVEALGPQGSVGTGRARLETALPVYLDVDMPGYLTTGDRYDLPVIVANHTAEPAELDVHAAIAGSMKLAGKQASQRIALPAGTTGMVAVRVHAHAVGTGTVELTLRRAGGQAVDAVKRTVDVQAPGHLVRSIPGGKTSGDDTRFAFTVPERRAEGTVKGTLRLYRGVVDQAIDGLEGMLKEPYGCFEQTSSATYPNLLVLGLLDDTPRNAALRARARDLVARGYQRLIKYEVDGGGFSWFGESPANQVLTAYGLMEFTDMARVYPVDPALIERTQTWLLAQQKPDGSWEKDPSWLHDWNAVQGRVSTTAYIAWALAESGHGGEALDRAFAYLAKHQKELEENAYLLALWAAAESARDPGKGHSKDKNNALALLRKRTEVAEQGGPGMRFRAGDTTLFYARGDGADVQVTALAALALQRTGASRDANAALSWLWSARSPSYGWGTTQGTVLALRAAQAIVSKKPVTGTIQVLLDGKELGSIDLDAGPDAATGSAGVPSLALPEGLAPGPHEVVLRGAGDALEKGALRGDLRVSWRESGAPAAQAQGMVVSLSASKLPVRVGQRYDMTLLVQNPGAEAIAMPTAVIPVPPGFRAVAESLKALEQSGRVDRAEDLGSEIHLYMSKLDARGSLVLPYRLEATAACDVAQPSARAYAYYDPETRGASASLRLTAKARK